MKALFICTCIFIAFTFSRSSVSASGGCGNNSKNGVTSCPCDTCPKSGDPFDPYTGNEHRTIKDLEIWGAVGQEPFIWKRFYNSRAGLKIWTFSYQFTMEDEGTNSQGQSQLLVTYPQ